MRLSTKFSSLAVSLVAFIGLMPPDCLATDYFIWKGSATDGVADYTKYNVSDSTGTDSGTVAESEIPSGSIVFIPNNATYHVDDDTANFCGTLAGLKPQGSGSVIELDFEGNHSLGCYIYGGNNADLWKASVIKSGVGKLTLTADGTGLVYNSRRMYYCATWHVTGGEVVFWPSAAATAYHVENITVDEGATITLPPGKASVFINGFIAGGGTFAHATGGDAGTLLVAGHSPTAVFTGSITGNVKLQLNGRANMKTATNTFTGGVASYSGTLGFTNLGNNNATSSSIGQTGDIAIYTGLTLVNLADATIGATSSSRGFRHFGNTTDDIYTLQFDGGDYGAFTFSGSLHIYCNNVLSCVLQGNHENVCTFKPTVDQKNSTKGWYMLTKRGTGIWKVSGNYSTEFGGMMIENGILQMTRIKAIGAWDGGYTSCGWLTNTAYFCGYAYKGGVASSPTPVGYAIRLGKADDLLQCGLLEYVGTENVSCLNRAFALTGKGGFKNETEKNFIIGPIASEPLPEGGTAPTLNTLVLESSNAAVNETRNITENAGAIRIEKRGTGAWILNCELGFSGGVDVQCGTLVISNQVNYAVLPDGLDYVKTRAGTTLKVIGESVTLNALTIDAEKGLGDIKNCAFATTGTLYLLNYPEKAAQNFAADLSSAAGLANLSNWTIVLNETESTKYRVRADATGLRVDYTPPGLMLIFR